MNQVSEHKITKSAVLIELNGEAVILKISAQGWNEILAIAAREAEGELCVAKVPNQDIFNLISTQA